MKKHVIVAVLILVAILASIWKYLFAALPILAVAVVVAVVVFVPLIATVVLFGFPWLAEENVLFTTVKASTAKAIMRGKSFERFIMSFAGYHLNDSSKPGYRPLVIRETTDRGGKEAEARDGFPDWEVVYHGKGNKNGFLEKNKDGENEQDDDYHDRRHPVLKHLGLYWVGWPWRNSVHVYQFQWNVTFTDKQTGDEEMLPRAEPADFAYVNDVTYAIKTVGAETRDRLSIDALTLVTIAVRNPYRALFIGEDWMRRMTAAVNRHVRNFITGKGYDELISMTKDNADVKEGEKTVAERWALEFSQPIIDLNDKLSGETDKSPKPWGLRGKYGIDMRAVDLQTLELSGSSKEKLQEVAMKQYAAEQEAKAERLVGQAKADVVEMMGKKEAEALATRLEVIKAHGEAGIALAGYDAIQGSSKGPGNTIIWGNNPLALLAGLLKSKTKGGEK